MRQVALMKTVIALIPISIILILASLTLAADLATNENPAHYWNRSEKIAGEPPESLLGIPGYYAHKHGHLHEHPHPLGSHHHHTHQPSPHPIDSEADHHHKVAD